MFAGKFLIITLTTVCLSLCDDSSKSSEESSEIFSRKREVRCIRKSVLDELRDQKIEQFAEKLTGQDLVDFVNKKQNLWTAKLYSKFESLSNRVKRGMLGVKHMALSADERRNLSPTRFSSMYIPEQFDSREHWDMCPSIKNIRDQSSCGSCWAFGAVEAMSDRICIASKGKIHVSLSADDLLSCCRSCGFGCNGGEPMEAWQYWVHNGIVTGSNFTSHDGCKPYPFPPCEHHSNKTHYKPCHHDLYPTPKCEKTCVPSYHDKSYLQDKFYGEHAYAVEDDVLSIQKEILTHGPVEASFEVYEDFLTYGSGVYKHVAGAFDGGHAVKLIGWGIDQGVPYWTAANSWNADWGEDGFFRILRGVDECGIESGIVAGLPKLPKLNGTDAKSKDKFDEFVEIF